MSFLINSYRFAAAIQYPSGAAMIWGLREVPGYSWTGALIRVRRSSDNTEADFYQGATAGDLNTVRGGGGTELGAWVGAGNNGWIKTVYDQSGNGNNLNQTTSTRQPRIVTNGAVLTDNGKPRIDFANNGGAETELLLTSSLTAAENWTSFLVGRRSSSGEKLWGFTGGSTGVYTHAHFSDNNIYMRSRSGYIVTNSTDTSATQYLLNVTMAGSTRTLRKNGAAVATTFFSGALTESFDAFGSAWTSRSEIANAVYQEGGIWLSDKSANNSDIETTVNNYYGIF